MRKYPKINSLYKRDQNVKGHPIIVGDYATQSIADLSEAEWEWTEKLDGTNIRIGYDYLANRLDIRGRTDRAQLPPALLSSILDMENELMRMLSPGRILFCEGVGAGIQKGGGNYCSGQTIVLFDVFDETWHTRDGVQRVAGVIGIRHAAVVGGGTLPMAEDLVCTGLRSELGEFLAEGVVCRPVGGYLEWDGTPVMTKIKARDFA